MIGYARPTEVGGTNARIELIRPGDEMTDEFKNLEMAEYGDQIINEYWTAAIRGSQRNQYWSYSLQYHSHRTWVRLLTSPTKEYSCRGIPNQIPYPGIQDRGP